MFFEIRRIQAVFGLMIIMSGPVVGEEIGKIVEVS